MRQPTNLGIGIAASLLVLLPAALSAQNVGLLPQGSRVLASDSRGITIEVVPSVTFNRTDNGLLLPLVAGAVLANGRDMGQPMSMVITIPVALPGPTGASLEVLGVTYADPIDARLAPVPTLQPDSLGFSRPRYNPSVQAYAAWSASRPVAELRYTGIARDVHSGVIGVLPYQFDARANRLRPVLSVRLRLNYGSAAVAVRGMGGPLSEFTRSAFVNSNVASAWRVDQRPSSLARRTAGPHARAWLRVEVKEEGLYEVTSDDFKQAGVDLATVDPARIAVYGGDGGPLPEFDLMIDTLAMHKVPAIVEQAGGKPTRVLFYGAGPVRWRVKRNDSIPSHFTNPYTSTNSYLIAVDGDNGIGYPAGGANGTPDVTLGTGISRLLQEEERLNAVDIRKSGGSGRDWFGTQFQVDDARPADPRVFPMKLTGVDRSQRVLYRIRCANAGRSAANGGPGTFTVEQENQALGSFMVPGVGGEGIAWASAGTFVGGGGDIGADEMSRLRITYSNGVPATGYLDWYEIHYTRSLKAENDRLSFWSPAGTGLARYEVVDLSSNDVLGFDVTDPANPLQLQPQATDGRFVFTDQLRAPAASRHYFVCTRGSAKRVESVHTADIADLRARSLDVDVLVIAHPDFMKAGGRSASPVQRYLDHRRARGLSVEVVTTEQIYNEFSNGNLDPTAIRNYIAWAFSRWSHKLQYVVLFGDGSYDYRNIATRQKPLVPPYETDDADVYDHIESSCYDDFYARVTADGLGQIDAQTDVAIGRLAVETVDQADDVVDKIIRYEDVRNFGLWRQQLLLAADDDYPLGEGGGFTRQSESLWRLVPNWMEPKKVYVAAYPTEQAATRRKPAAEQDLSQSMDRGSVITNWVGHGNPNVWAHEYILEKDKFITSLTNDSLLTYVSAVTCNFGYFDDPTVVSGAELFLLHPTGGAIAVMTATRAVYIPPNEELMRSHFRALYARDPVTRAFPTIGQALMTTKFGRSGFSSNDEKFFLLGDPVLRLNLPTDSVEITAINGKRVDSAVVQVGALSQVTIEGVVRDQFGTLRADFNGTAIVSLYDADRTTKMESGEETPTVVYYGGRLFRGPANVTNGKFSITFRVPKDISFDSTAGRIHVYAYNANSDAAGATSNVRVFGADTTTVTDVKGPAILVYMGDRSFRSGDVVAAEPMLLVDLADPSGINSSGSSIGHRIEAWVDGDARSVDLTDSYQTLPTNYAEGSAERRLVGLTEPGEHTVRVRAWDIYNNAAEATAYFRIAEGNEQELRVEDVVNFPNPMARETDFLFRHNQTKPLDVHVSIYTTSGRKIRDLELKGTTDRFVRVHWDGTDADGQSLANGVYLYRLRVNVAGVEGGQQFETIEKVAVAR